MTPVDDRLKKMYHDYLAGFGIESFYPPQILRAHTDAQKLTSSDVEEMTRKALERNTPTSTPSTSKAPCSIRSRFSTSWKRSCKLPIVASNPAMLWLVLSKLGLNYHIEGYGKLLESWPDLPAGPF